jgi:hypothetical protein
MMRRADLSRLISIHLILLHQITRASLPLMEAAHREARRMSGDRISHALMPYLERHVEEERDHDQWTLEDLESIGIARAHTLAARPSANVAALVGAQYYWILHYHPVALLGYMAVLETNAPTENLVERLQALTGLPDSVFRTHRIHAALDPGHEAALYSLVDRLPLDDSHERLIADSAAHTGAKLADCLAEMLSVDSNG